MTRVDESTSVREAAAAVDAGVDPDTGAELDVGAIFDRHGPGLLRYLTRRVGPAAAEDLVGDTFEVLVADPGRYDPERGPERSWLYGVATNLMLHHLRRGGRERAAVERLARVGASGSDLAVEVADRVDAARHIAALAARIDELAPDDREVLLLTAWTDLTAAEIAEALGAAPGTVRSRLHRARRTLRGVEGALQRGIS